MARFIFSTFGLVDAFGSLEAVALLYKSKCLTEKAEFQKYNLDNGFEKIVNVLDNMIMQMNSVPVFIELIDDIYKYAKLAFEKKDLEKIHGILFFLGV